MTSDSATFSSLTMGILKVSSSFLAVMKPKRQEIPEPIIIGVNLSVNISSSWSGPLLM